MSRTYSEIAPKSSFAVAGPFPAGLVAKINAGLGGLSDRLLTWHQRTRERRALQQLDRHMLQDVGLSPADVEREAGKFFWQA